MNTYHELGDGENCLEVEHGTGFIRFMKGNTTPGRIKASGMRLNY
jgi:hypothetical protein